MRRIELYYQGGALRFAENTTAVPLMATPTSPTPASVSTAPEPNILIVFRHGLGDAVQFTAVLRHLRRHRPDWAVDVAALVGKHSAFHSLCRRVFVLDREPVPRANYQRVFDLAWPEGKMMTLYAAGVLPQVSGEMDRRRAAVLPPPSRPPSWI